MIDFSIHTMSRERYNEMLRDAAQERRAYQIRQANRPQRTPFLAQVGDWLIESGSWLKQQNMKQPNQMRPGLS